jgi:AcrR family transcriptional regulator
MRLNLHHASVLQYAQGMTPDKEPGPLTRPETGRVNQRARTRAAIVQAAAELSVSGREVTMPLIARAALVSEATAYRYFPDLPSLLAEAMAANTPGPAEALGAAGASIDPVERVAAATRFLGNIVREREGAVRAMIAHTVVHSAPAEVRPVLRFGLIDCALAPVAGTLAPAALAQLRRDLAVVISAEAFFSLTDMCQLTFDEAIASAVHTATALTAAALDPGRAG